MPISAADVKIVLSAQDNASGAIKQFGANAEKALRDVEGSTAKLNGMLGTLKENWLGLTAAAYAVKESLAKAWNLAETAAQYEEQKAGLNTLAAQYGTTADQIVQSVKDVVDGQLSLVESSQLASKAMLLGLNPDQIVKFVGYAERLTDVAGGEIPAAFEAMEKAAATGRAKGLVQYGILVDMNKALEDYATAHGIAKDQIDATTVMQIRANAIMEVAKQKTDLLGEGTESNADKMKAMVKTLRDIELWTGQVVIRGVSVLTGTFYLLGAASLTASAGLWKLIAAKERFMALTTFGDWSKEHKALADYASGNAADDFKMSLEWAGKTQDAYGTAFSSAEELDKARRMLLRTNPNYEPPGRPGGKTPAVGVKSDILTDAEQAEILAKDTLSRVQQVWEDNDEWMKTHVWDEVLGDYVELSNEQVKVTQDTVEMASKQFDALQQTIEGWGRDSADAIVDFATGGKTSFKDMIDSMIKDLLRMMVYQNIMKPLFGSNGESGLIMQGIGMLGSMFGGGTVNGTAYNADVAANFTGRGLGFHKGGMLNEPTFYRIGINPKYFEHAPRYHSGIGPGETAAILRKDEGVFTQGQMKAMGLMANQGGGGSVTVNNYNIQAMDAKSFEDFAKRNAATLQGVTSQGMRDNKTRREMKGLLR